MHITVFASTIAPGKLTVYISTGDKCVTTLKLTPEEAHRLADDLRKTADAMPRHRVGGPADLGCEAL